MISNVGNSIVLLMMLSGSVHIELEHEMIIA